MMMFDLKSVKNEIIFINRTFLTILNIILIKYPCSAIATYAIWVYAVGMLNMNLLTTFLCN